ncbi:hypothetical protein Bbelb_381590 [Branchiostoma belcheri]|nr:hypothetical protein Bbelb_381590 [Branchiostoma belcheri]
MRRCRVEAKLPVLVFRMPGGHQVVVTTAENGLPSFTVTLHTENNWKCCGPAELLNVLQPVQNQPEAAMASWQLEHPTPTEGDETAEVTLDCGDKEGAEEHPPLRREDTETCAASVLSVQRPVSATGPVPTLRRRLAPTGQASTSTAPTASDNTGTTDPTPTGYSDGETESLDDSTPDFSLLADVRLSLSPTDTEPTTPPSISTPTPSSPSALLPVPKKRRLAATPRKPTPGLKLPLKCDIEDLSSTPSDIREENKPPEGTTSDQLEDDALELEDARHLFFDPTNEEPELEDVTHLFFDQTNEEPELEDMTHLFFDQTNEEPELEDRSARLVKATNKPTGTPKADPLSMIGSVGGLPRLQMDTALYNNPFKEVSDRQEAGKCPFNVRNAKKDEPKQQGRVKPSNPLPRPTRVQCVMNLATGEQTVPTTRETISAAPNA